MELQHFQFPKRQKEVLMLWPVTKLKEQQLLNNWCSDNKITIWNFLEAKRHWPELDCKHLNSKMKEYLQLKSCWQLYLSKWVKEKAWDHLGREVGLVAQVPNVCETEIAKIEVPNPNWYLECYMFGLLWYGVSQRDMDLLSLCLSLSLSLSLDWKFWSLSLFRL